MVQEQREHSFVDLVPLPPVASELEFIRWRRLGLRDGPVFDFCFRREWPTLLIGIAETDHQVDLVKRDVAQFLGCLPRHTYTKLLHQAVDMGRDRLRLDPRAEDTGFWRAQMLCHRLGHLAQVCIVFA